MSRLECVLANRNRWKVSKMKSWNEIRKAATAFSKRWKKESFAVFGVDIVLFNTFEHRVKFG